MRPGTPSATAEEWYDGLLGAKVAQIANFVVGATAPDGSQVSFLLKVGEWCLAPSCCGRLQWGNRATLELLHVACRRLLAAACLLPRVACKPYRLPRLATRAVPGSAPAPPPGADPKSACLPSPVALAGAWLRVCESRWAGG